MKKISFKPMLNFVAFFSLLTALFGVPSSSTVLAAGSQSVPVSPLMTYNAWGSLGLGSGPNNIVYATAINGSNVYIGGQFTSVNSITNTTRIAKWNGISWSALGSGINNGQVNALAINGSDLYVGGTFTSAGGVSGADYIAKWNGSTWSTFGNGISGAGSSVNAIGVSSNGLDIYIAGNFTNAGGDTNADYIAKLDGGTWAALGSTPLTGAVNTIIVAGPSVYAGGDFVDVGGNSNIDRIALWDGSSWTPLGNGLGASVSTIALNGTDLYAGGQFTDAGGDVNADRIAKWDGSSWSALGSGLNSFVSAIAISGGKLYAGGHFTNAGGDANADYIAQWDGVSWSALGNTALNNDVASIVIDGLLVYAGGTFTTAGGVSSANRIAFFQFENTLPTVTSFTATSPSNSLNVPITAFTASDNVGVTGYKITESATPPLASDAGWTGSAPSTYTVASSGSYTLYPWVKDASGNVSAVYGSPASVFVDASAPTVTSFSAPSTSSSLTISPITLIASDNVSVTGYKITESSTPPLAGDAGWTGSPPSNYTVSSAGTYTLYPWAKDALGNVSAVYGSPASVTVCTPGTLTITSSNDSGAGTLRQAIAAACAGATINFNASLSGSTIYLASTLTLSQNMTIDGSALASQITISGDTNNDTTGDVRVFTVNSGVIVTLDSLTITKGFSSPNGGGINNAGTVTITNSTLSGNSATNGGGIYNSGTLTIANSTLSGNSAVQGGGIHNNSGTLTITNSTLSGNSASTGGVGGSLYNAGTLTISNSTLSGNSATNGGGIYNHNTGTLNYSNTIIANSTVGGDCDNNNGGTIGTNTKNLVEDNTCSPALFGDPNLGPLTNNGGPTQTFALLVPSPAIDAGDDSTCTAAPVNNLDQRGITRTLGAHCDIGAYEYQDATIPTVDSFAATSPSTSLNIPITSFTASDDLAITGYIITESSTPPLAGDAGWTGSAPSTYTVASSGTYTLYPWAKDTSGNISALYGSPASVDVDVDIPVVTDFSVPSSSTSLDIPITTFTASDNIGVADYLVTESSTPPLAGDTGWTASAPTTYTVNSSGSYTLYPWTKDAAGNVSAAYGSPATVTACVPGPITVTSNNDSGAGTLRQAIAAACAGANINFDSALAGGVIYLQSTLTLNKNVTIDGSSLTSQITISGDSNNNGSGDVGVFYVDNAVTAATLDSLTITKGMNLSIIGPTNGYGGGIENNGTLTITNSTFIGNLATNGGAIFNNGANGNQGSLTVSNSTFILNAADLDGGAILNSAGVVTVTNSTFYGNNVMGNGGAISQVVDGTITIINSTISSNSAAGSGAGLYIPNASGNFLHYANTIIANSGSGGDCVADASRIVTNVNNLVENGGCLATFSADPKLGALANNGGPTQTFALLTNSPAINAGDNATCAAAPVNNLDQRGNTRPDGATCDIGAFEADAAPTVTSFTVSSPSSSLNIPVTAFTASDTGGVTGYLITENSTKPSSNNPGWTASAPTSYTLPNMGNYTLYPWAKDTAGNISAVYGSPAAVVACIPGSQITVTSTADSGAGTLRQALAEACAGTTIDFDSSLSGATIYLSSTLWLSRDVTIDGSSLASQVKLSGDGNNDGNSDVRVFLVEVNVTATLDSLTITKGHHDYGGGIFNDGTLTVRDSTLSNNTGQQGGGIFNSGTLTVRDSTLSGGNAMFGGGIFNDDGPVTVVNSTFSDNYILSTGGAILMDSDDDTTLINVTMSGNPFSISQLSGAGKLNYSNTIITNSPFGTNCYTNNSLGTNTNNLVADGTCSSALSGDPMLGALASNGGPTQTFALLAGSPAINAGDSTTCAASPVSGLDQRGVARPQGASCDIGAYELDAIAPTVVSSMRVNANPTKLTSVSFTVTFSESVSGVDTADFSLTTTGVTGASITGVTGSGATRTVTVSTGSGNGTIRLNVLDNDSIKDTAGNTLAGSFTSGQAYTVKKPVTLTIMSTNTQDGWVLESSENGNKGSTLNSTLTTFRLGDDASKKQYRGILSFKTSVLPDNAVITAVTLKVKKQGIVGGGNPLTIFQGFFADVKTGFFGTAAALQFADFQATSSKIIGPTNGTFSANWYSINLVNAKTFINKLTSNSGLTQIRLRFKLDDNNNAIANYLSLYSGNAPAGSRPQLVITYSIP